MFCFKMRFSVICVALFHEVGRDVNNPTRDYLFCRRSKREILNTDDRCGACGTALRALPVVISQPLKDAGVSVFPPSGPLPAA